MYSNLFKFKQNLLFYLNLNEINDLIYNKVKYTF
jgi:hypothetical protein